MYLSRFRSIRPRFKTPQQHSLEWLVLAHTQAETLAKGLSPFDAEGFGREIKDKLLRVGCKPDQIAYRGHVLEDPLHGEEWDKMKVYRLLESPQGENLSVRTKVYEEEVDKVFQEYYPEDSQAPSHLIHVTCTGYSSPSGAQKIVSCRNWGHETTVTHAYHMGCYGSLPALRMARGLEKSVDIVHTEICTLHSNPAMHALDQLVSQSLFADGFMKYSVAREGKGLKVLALHEEIIPNSREAMTWSVADWGFQMSLSKEVPILIARHMPLYLERFLKKEVLKKALFAIHPGGPKILNFIQQLLGATDEQMRFSFQILKEYGNMSSATLPHIWQAILEDKSIPDHTPILSLGFGPGLTVAGALMEKQCGS